MFNKYESLDINDLEKKITETRTQKPVEPPVVEEALRSLAKNDSQFSVLPLIDSFIIDFPSKPALDDSLVDIKFELIDLKVKYNLINEDNHPRIKPHPLLPLPSVHVDPFSIHPKAAHSDKNGNSSSATDFWIPIAINIASPIIAPIDSHLLLKDLVRSTTPLNDADE